MKRTLHLRKDVLAELTPTELEIVAGANYELTHDPCPVVQGRLTLPLLTCLFKCTEV